MPSNTNDPPMGELDSLLQSGISAARVGHEGWAREMLTRAVELEPDCLEAWLWLSGVSWTPEEKARCLEQVLRLDPEHDDARRGLDHLRAQTRQRPYPPAEPQPPTGLDPVGADPRVRPPDPRVPTRQRPYPPATDWDPIVAPQPDPVGAHLRVRPPRPAPVAELSPSLAYSSPGLPAFDPEPSLDPYFSPEPDLDELLQAGIDAASAHQVDVARELLGRVIQVDEKHIAAWLWLSYVADNSQERDHYVKKMLTVAGVDATLRPPTSAAAPAATGLATEWSAPEHVFGPGRDAGEPAVRTAPRRPSLGFVAVGASTAVQGLRSSVAGGGSTLGPALAGASTAVQGLRSSVVERASALRPALAPAPAGAPAGVPGRPFYDAVAVDASAAVETLRKSIADWATVWALTAQAYLLGIMVAELLTTFARPALGMLAHSLLLVTLLVHASRVRSQAKRAFLVSMAFAPLIRILSLSLPLAQIPIIYWYLITSIPLFAAVFVAARTLGFSWNSLGMNLRGWPLQLAIGLTGIAFGIVEYAILRPDPLAQGFELSYLWRPALILLVSTGLLEEMIFRGLLQRTSTNTLGRWGLLYVPLLFAVLHIGYMMFIDVVFVFFVGLFFAWVVQRTRSLLGVTIAHGLTNIMLFLVMPFVMG